MFFLQTIVLWWSATFLKFWEVQIPHGTMIFWSYYPATNYNYLSFKALCTLVIFCMDLIDIFKPEVI